MNSADSSSLRTKRVTQRRAQPTRATGLPAFLDESWLGFQQPDHALQRSPDGRHVAGFISVQQQNVM